MKKGVNLKEKSYIKKGLIYIYIKNLEKSGENKIAVGKPQNKPTTISWLSGGYCFLQTI